MTGPIIPCQVPGTTLGVFCCLCLSVFRRGGKNKKGYKDERTKNPNKTCSWLLQISTPVLRELNKGKQTLLAGEELGELRGDGVSAGSQIHS